MKHGAPAGRRDGIVLWVTGGLGIALAITLLTVVGVRNSTAQLAIIVSCTIVPAIASVVPIKFPSLARRLAFRLVVALWVIDLACAASWLGWKMYAHYRQIDALGSINLSQNVNISPGGHAYLTLDVGIERSSLVLVFRVEDHDASIGDCASTTGLFATVDGAGNRGESRRVVPGQGFKIAIPNPPTRIHLELETRNERDKNCAVDVTVVDAKLTNS